tara:strand:+ start:210 stop:677 length:468 start_codon:yes stop_codon:yes gene_type:complete
MSAWGNKDDIASPGTVTVTGGTTVTGTATVFANNYTIGDVITITDSGTATILTIANSTVCTVTPAITNVSSKAFTVSEKPISPVVSDGTVDPDKVFGVSVAEQGVSTANTHHAGWVKIDDRYTDAHGKVRQKSEVLVAMSTITGDAADDVQLPDA